MNDPDGGTASAAAQRRKGGLRPTGLAGYACFALRNGGSEEALVVC